MFWCGGCGVSGHGIFYNISACTSTDIIRNVFFDFVQSLLESLYLYSAEEANV